jgi:hypothetical protein
MEKVINDDICLPFYLLLFYASDYHILMHTKLNTQNWTLLSLRRFKGPASKIISYFQACGEENSIRSRKFLSTGG